MFKYVKKSIHAKLLVVIIAIMTVGVIFSITYELKMKERDLLEEKLQASRLMAKPLLDVVLEDMVEQRADLARRLFNTLGRVRGMEIRIIRNNGVEEAFQDLKTIEKVRRKYGRIRPEWLAGHKNKRVNVAVGTESQGFKEAYKGFKKDWKSAPVYYKEERGGRKLFTFLQPIDRGAKCAACHGGSDARGILMISTPLEDMYAILSRNRKDWLIAGILCVFIGGIIISILVKKTVTGPLGRKMSIIKRIADGEAEISERIEVRSTDEMGYLAEAFNKMLSRLEGRAEENRRLFESVEKSKAEWEATFDSIQDLISIHDKDDRIIRVNTALASKCRKTPAEMIGMSCEELFYGGAASHALCPHRKTIETASSLDVVLDGLVMEGTFKITTFPILGEGGAISAVVHVARDISMEKLLGEKLLHAEKLSSMGKLVAGIAHELNNPLMGIMGFSQLLMDTPDSKRIKDVRGKLEKISHESMRTARIVQNLLTFARASASKREYTDINESIRGTIDLRGYSLRSNNINISLNLDKTLPPTMVDKYQLQQVFINLINNAEDAILEASGSGTLEIRTGLTDGSIEITFSDDGPGVPQALLGKVFDPFFTTKDVGKGTGLGLSITHGIIAEHGGSISLENKDGENKEGSGAVVTITLPLRGQRDEDSPGSGVGAEYAHLQGIENESILLVEDEPVVRESLYVFLSGQGLSVDEVSGGAEAAAALRRKEGRYSIVVTDLRMAGLNGIELYNQTVTQYPWLKKKFIMLTGDVFSDDTKAFLDRNSCPCLLKPFEPRELLDAIKRQVSI